MPQPIQINQVDFGYELTDNPIQAIGQIRGREFQFLAKHSNWNFEVANDSGEFPSDVGGNAVFSLHSRHSEAGGLTPNQAIDIIDRCCQLFLEVTYPHLKALGK